MHKMQRDATFPALHSHRLTVIPLSFPPWGDSSETIRPVLQNTLTELDIPVTSGNATKCRDVNISRPSVAWQSASPYENRLLTPCCRGNPPLVARSRLPSWERARACPVLDTGVRANPSSPSALSAPSAVNLRLRAPTPVIPAEAGIHPPICPLRHARGRLRAGYGGERAERRSPFSPKDTSRQPLFRDSMCYTNRRSGMGMNNKGQPLDTHSTRWYCSGIHV